MRLVERRHIDVNGLLADIPDKISKNEKVKANLAKTDAALAYKQLTRTTRPGSAPCRVF